VSPDPLTLPTLRLFQANHYLDYRTSNANVNPDVEGFDALDLEFVSKYVTLGFLTALMCCVALYLVRETSTYVDASIGNDANVWTDCFDAGTPSEKYGFIKEWCKQEWDEAGAMTVALFALI
jgi:hypothetical protein